MSYSQETIDALLLANAMAQEVEKEALLPCHSYAAEEVSRRLSAIIADCLEENGSELPGSRYRIEVPEWRDERELLGFIMAVLDEIDDPYFWEKQQQPMSDLRQKFMDNLERIV